MNWFTQWRIYLLLIVDWFTYKYLFHLSNNCCLSYYWMHTFDHLLIDWTNILSLLWSFYNFAVIIFKWLKVKTCFKRFLFWVISPNIEFESIFLWSFIFALLSLIVDFFVRVNRIIVHWFWNLSLGVITNCMWDLLKP